MLEGKHRFLESKSNKAPGKESDFKLAALCRRDRLPKYFCNNIGQKLPSTRAWDWSANELTAGGRPRARYRPSRLICDIQGCRIA